MDRIQRNFLKFLSFKVDGTYSARGTEYTVLLNKFNFHSLERKRCSAVSFIYKLLRSGIDCPEVLVQINFLVPRLVARQNSHKSRTHVHLKSPITYICHNVNKISNYCNINICTTKQRLDTAIRHIKKLSF